ncbi:oxidoreductase [Motiliproteus coralliicola]|uniref:Oxidoreductase n=1 Tax=Motiliproteus coralliicola TaxID=2283196 RepID=A0A369WQT6_9GAMM|nr:proton-conducting transporter membrane subunit [Motiliproteus coralliicola]RDE24062.1 oxidoreductase [Motiliproteus coralliicola]
MSTILIVVVIVPLLASLTCLMLPRLSDRLSLGTGLVQLITGGLLIQSLASGISHFHELGGWSPGLGIALRADALAGALVLLCAIVSLAATVYARRYFTCVETRYRFWPLWWLLSTAIYALLLSADLFNLYVTLELLGLSAAALCTIGAAKTEALRSALRYLMLGLVGSLLFLAGVSMVYAEYGTLSLMALAGQIAQTPATLVALLLLSSGLLVKCALVPLHFWLPAAHGSAPAPVSAVLSALVVKVAFYLLLRLWFELFSPVMTSLFATLIGGLGAIAVIWGSLRALTAARLKLLAAYSTLSQMGYLFVFIPVLAALPDEETRQLGFGALVLFALSHGIAKAALFLGIGVIQLQVGHDRIDQLAGSAQRFPIAFFAIGLAGVALVGLPPSGAFLAKWSLISNSLLTGQWWWMVVTLTGTLLAAAYFIRVLGAGFVTLGPEAPVKGVGVSLQAPALVLACLATFGLGLGAASLWDVLAMGSAGGQL